MKTLTAEQLENPADNLVELVEALDKIAITPEKIATYSVSMLSPDGTIITY